MKGSAFSYRFINLITQFGAVKRLLSLVVHRNTRYKTLVCIIEIHVQNLYDYIDTTGLYINEYGGDGNLIYEAHLFGYTKFEKLLKILKISQKLTEIDANSKTPEDVLYINIIKDMEFMNNYAINEYIYDLNDYVNTLCVEGFTIIS
jgi:hypothetical protein